ncbi:MAG: response regulator [Synergistaceae bacterium]|jgi:signal transduction histidine kinase/DNA-binding response OmpR family regulator|nr:response regulator [Synergistaceae bacterium]
MNVGSNWKHVIRANYLQLTLVFAAFFLVVLAGCASIGNIMRRHLTEGLNDAMLAAEISVDALLSNGAVTLSNAAYTVRDMLERNASQGQVIAYLKEMTEKIRSERFGPSRYISLNGFIEGKLIDSLNLIHPGPDYIPQQRPWYDAAVRSEGDTIIHTEPYVDVRTGEVILSIVQNVRASSGESMGILMLDVDISWLKKYIDALHLVRGAYGMILTQNMVVVGHKHGEFVGRQLQDLDEDYAELPQLLLMRKAVRSARITDADGTASLASFLRMGNGWYLGVIIPLHDYYGYMYNTITLLVLMGVSLAACLGYLLLRLSAAKMRSDEENKSKSAFLARMSHEIRTPMNAVMGLSELGLRTDSLPLTGEYFAGIKQAGQNLLSIINDILDFSKIESGNLGITPAPYILASLLNDVVNIIRVRLSEKPLLFAANIQSSLPNNLIGDETRVRQVLLNILSNAAKYTFEGFIMFSATGERTGEDTIVLKLEVADSGIGIKPEDIKGLFGEFVRFDAKRNKGVEGTGLGLAITKKLCLAMGGDITVTSVYGEGSVFTAAIPQKFDGDSPVAVVDDVKEKSVLFCDERPLYVDSIHKTLEDLGVAVTTAADGEEFMDKLAEGAYRFALVSPTLAARARDFLNGAKTANAKADTTLILLAGLNEMPAFRDLPVIIMPAYAVSLANALNNETLIISPSKPGARFSAPSARVLLVDDILTNLVVAKGLLAPYMMTVDTCESGEESIALVRENEYDLVLMDHMMPGMDGIEATKAIRALGGGLEKLPIVALTANAVSGMHEMFLKRGMDDFISKPIDPAKLDAILRKWIPKEKQRTAVHREPAAPKESVLFELEGVDMKRGMAMASGSEENYRGVLKIYCRDVADRMEFLSVTCAEKDLKNFVVQVHALKSASTNIGATALAETAALLESAGKRGDLAFIWERVGVFRDGLTALVQNIETALSPAAPEISLSEPESAPLEEVVPLLTSLQESLAAEDVRRADDLIAELGELRLDTATAAVVSRVSDLLLLAEFEEAAQTIKSRTLSGGRAPQGFNQHFPK